MVPEPAPYQPVVWPSVDLIRERGSEERLIRWWSRLKPGTVLADKWGKKILILHPGIRSRGEGPDFQGTRFFYQGRYQTGDTECHWFGREWFSHGHDKNHAYAGVKIHLLGRPTSSDGNLSGAILYFPGDSEPAGSCSLHSSRLPSHWPGILRRFSQKRWQEKIRYFLTASTPGFDSMLFTAFQLLGKGGNERSFQYLAGQVVSLTQEKLDRKAVNRCFRKWQKDLPWKQGGIRPPHHPGRRWPLAEALVVFLYHFKAVWWCQAEAFEQAFQARFGSLGGTGIQTELKGNVFYPYLAASSLERGNLVYYREWAGRYDRLRLPYGYGKFIRRFKNVLGMSVLRSFPMLQGLLELDRQFCRPGHCGLCPLKGYYGHLD